MKLSSLILFSFLLAAGAPVATVPAPARAELPWSLTRLADRAQQPRAWPELRRYAQARRPPREQALAYFILGYREFQANDYDTAEDDLANTSEIVPSLADLARYYHAAAAYKAGHPQAAIDLLQGFSRRFPGSYLRYDALGWLGWAYLQTGQPEQALKALDAEPAVRQRPDLALLLAQAYVDAGNLRSAARAYQDVYNAFPASPQGGAAGSGLEKLRLKLGVEIPPVSDGIATARVDKLFALGRYADALQGYQDLLSTRQKSPAAWRWNLGRAQCLIRLGRAGEAIETLVGSSASAPEVDAQRLAILVEAYVKDQNDTAAAQAVNQLGSSYLKSPWHAAALYAFANYLMRKGERNLAGPYYRTLALLFPQTSQGLAASWRLAWIEYLAGPAPQAQALLVQHITNYPQSAHVPAALYYLARLKEKDDPAASRALYELLVRRYVHGSYALAAARRLRDLPRAKATGEADGPRPDFSLDNLAAKIPAASTLPFEPCALDAPAEQLRAFDLLRAVHLDTLAEQSLSARLARDPGSAPLRLALGRLAAERKQHDRALHSAKMIVPNYDEQQFSDLPREFWDLLYPVDYHALIRRHAEANHLDPYLVMGLIRQESGYNPRATSPANAMVMMQNLPATVTRSARHQRLAAARLYTPAYNVRFGCAYLRVLLKQFNGNVAEALAAYNAGPSRVSAWLSNFSLQDPEDFVESIPFQETRVYVKSVLRDRTIYRELLTRRVEFAECRTHPHTRERRSAAGFPGHARRRGPVRPVSAARR